MSLGFLGLDARVTVGFYGWSTDGGTGLPRVANPGEPEWSLFGHGNAVYWRFAITVDRGASAHEFLWHARSWLQVRGAKPLPWRGPKDPEESILIREF
jgi:hypothetical protein